MATDLQRLKEKLLALEGTTPTPSDTQPVPLVDHSSAYRKRREDNYQYEVEYKDYPYDTHSYGTVLPPALPPPPPNDSASLLHSLPAAEAEVDALRQRMLSDDDGARLRQEWTTVQADVVDAASRLRQLLTRINVQHSAVPHVDVAVPDEARVEVFESPPQPWMSAGEDRDAFAQRALSMKKFVEVQSLRYKWATQESMRRALVAMTAMHRRLEADMAEAHGALALINEASRLVAHCEARAYTSKQNEEFIVNLNRVSEAEEKRVMAPRPVRERLAEAPPTTEEWRARQLGLYPAPGDVEFVSAVQRLSQRAATAQDPLRAWQDLGQCQREWAFIKEAAVALLGEISDSDERRDERRKAAEERYHIVRHAMATHNIEAIVQVSPRRQR